MGVRSSMTLLKARTQSPRMACLSPSPPTITASLPLPITLTRAWKYGHRPVGVAWARYRWWVWHGLGIDGGCGMG